MRKGTWSYSMPFGLNVGYASDYVYSKLFETENIGIVPVLSEFSRTGDDPSGFRHLTTHASFIETIASGEGIANSSMGHLDFAACDISPGSGVSQTRVFLFRIAELELTTTRVHGMKVWASNTDDFLTPQNAKILWETHQTWQGDYSIPASYMGDQTKWMPTSLPENQNLYRQDGKFTIHASGDADVSEWIYVAVAASGTMPLGQYGLTASSGFLIRVSYNADNITPFFD